VSFAKIQIRLNKQCGEACNIVTRAKIQGRGVLAKDRYRFKGRGVVHRSDEVFRRVCQMYRDKGLTIEIQAVVLIRVERALPLISPAYDRGETERQVKDRWRRYWRKLWEEVEE
jgi:hypothetical protein